jgi:hypothetical protein
MVRAFSRNWESKFSEKRDERISPAFRIKAVYPIKTANSTALEEAGPYTGKSPPPSLFRNFGIYYFRGYL